MPPLSPFPLPLQSLPTGFGWDDRALSQISTTTAFDTSINQRDQFLGRRCCVLCGDDTSKALQHCHIITASEPDVWSELKRHYWIPLQAKDSPRHEPRDGLLMCVYHRTLFDAYHFFIRFVPETRRFVLVNYSDQKFLRPYHGKAIALDIKDRYAPFPSLFIIHEMRVRGFHPFKPTSPVILDDSPWQDWILSDGVYDDTSDSFKREPPPAGNDDNDGSILEQSQPLLQSSGGGFSGGQKIELNANVIEEILAATRAMPSWKACEMEGTSWAGTADENIQKYVSTIGVEKLD